MPATRTDGLAGLADHKGLAGRRFLHQPGEMGLGFVQIHPLHGLSMRMWAQMWT